MITTCVICLMAIDVDTVSVATQCGHIFHNVCVLEWLRSSKSCPQCRCDVSGKTNVRLFFNPVANSHVDDSMQSLKDEIQERDSKIKQLQDYAREVETNMETTRQNMLKSEIALKQEKLKLKEMKTALIRIQTLEQENTALMEDIKHYKNIQTVVQGSQKEIEVILKGYSSKAQTGSDRSYTQADITNLATYCSVLKRELRRTVEEKQQLQYSVTSLNKKLGTKMAEINVIKSKAKDLEEELDLIKSPNRNSEAFLNREIKLVSDSKKSNSEQETDTTLPISMSEQKDLTPISIEFSDKKKKLDIVVLDKKVKVVSVGSSPQLPWQFASRIAKRNDTEFDSITRIGYNGLGGHDKNIIKSVQRSNIKGFKSSVKKLKKF